MRTLRYLRLQSLLLWSLASFGLHLSLALAAGQRLVVIALVVVTAVLLSATASSAMIVASAREMAITAPPTNILTLTQDAGAIATPVLKPEAELLWNGYKNEYHQRPQNRAVLKNLILLATALDLPKDAFVYQRFLIQNDPLLRCSFFDSPQGLLLLQCEQ